ncbi:13336_t:CDS:2 [Gigaspora margarita]|uniref:13336_t:CDS:1 n=1 Tax=Gigaspora margarita TaxID=4874 RepID=A0ABN7VND8_GIGMA|nr:13336_t:CDS:2 [Gigaspora margarita]
MLEFNLSSVNINIEKTKHKFFSLLDNKLLIVINTYSVSKVKVFWSTKQNMLMYQESSELEVLLTNNPYEAFVFDKNKA